MDSGLEETLKHELRELEALISYKRYMNPNSQNDDMWRTMSRLVQISRYLLEELTK